jgi:outer membrane protein OmpA-like peptidoglycan-associated protein
MKRSPCITLLLLLIFSGAVLAQEDGECPKLADKKAIKTYQKAYDLMRDHHIGLAVPYFKQVIDLEPDAAEPYFYLGYFNFKYEENYTAAENYFLKAIEKCPYFDVYAYYYLGDIYSGREDWPKAVQYLKEFLKDPALIENDADQNRARALLKWAHFYNDLYNNPVPFGPKFLEGICTPNNEYLPCISPDGEIALYTRVFEMPPRKGDLYGQKSYKEALYYSNLVNGQFDGGQEMPYPFNKTDNMGGVSITINNSQLYVAVGNYMMDGYLNVDIYWSEKDADGNWSTLDTVPHINGRKTWDTQPSISSDGETLYFISDRPGGFGGGDIWCSHKNEKGEWSKPENLGPTINTRGEEKTPFIHTDRQTLYFSSGDIKNADGGVIGAGHEGLGGLDIFYSRLKDDGSWTTAKNIGYPINTEFDESGFLVSTNGKTGYFATNKLNGPGGYDVYDFPLYKEARPQDVLFMKGEVSQEDNKEPTNVRIELKNVETKKITEIPVDSASGKYVFAIDFRNDYIMTVKKAEYAYESKYIAKTDSVFEEPAVVDFEVKPIEVGKSYRLNDIYFATNSYELNDESRMVLDGFIEFLNENPTISASIEGHTDDVGNDEDNLVLSDNRARSVYDYLVLNKIDANRLSYKGFGETKPVTTNYTPEGRAKNRRTEFVITEK